MARQLAGRLDPAAFGLEGIFHLNRAATKQAQSPVGRGNDGRFQTPFGGPGIDDQRDAPAE